MLIQAFYSQEKDMINVCKYAYCKRHWKIFIFLSIWDYSCSEFNRLLLIEKCSRFLQIMFETKWKTSTFFLICDFFTGNEKTMKESSKRLIMHVSDLTLRENNWILNIAWNCFERIISSEHLKNTRKTFNDTCWIRQIDR